MRFLTSAAAFLALLATATAQVTHQFPLTSLFVTGVATSDSTLSANLAAGQTGTLQVYPSFSAYNQNALRYALEITAESPVNGVINYQQTALPGLTSTQQQVRVRNCASSLVNPTVANGFSYCSFVTPIISNNNGATNQVSLQNLYGPQFVELQTTAIFNSAPTIVSYVLAFGVFSSTVAGTNMLSLDVDFGGSQFDAPYTMQTSQYVIGYTVQLASSQATFPVPFYLATQRSVSSILVQECQTSCLNCNIQAINDRKAITSPAPTNTNNGLPFASVGASQIDSANSQFSATVFPKHGRYTFNAINGQNCVRFINRIEAVGGTNEYTITISLNVKNCGQFTTCAACSADTVCGWCQNDRFTLNSGSCRVGRVQALTGGTCTQSATFVDNRYIINPAQCQVVIKGDPRISGLQGQDFQVHGTPNEYFNLVSTPSLQVNSRFVYLDEAKCDNFTTCFSHPGTYIDEIGVMMGENKVRLVAGAIAESARVFVNGKEVKVSAHKHTAGKITVTFANKRRAVVKTPEFMMTISQSDKFFNVESALLKTELLDQGSKMLKLQSSRAAEANTVMHGLIGQTWRNNVYAGNREYEGEVSDYQVADGLWGKDFAFNLYKH